MGVKKGHQHKFELAWEHPCWEWNGRRLVRRLLQVLLCACGEPGYPVPEKEAS